MTFASPYYAYLLYLLPLVVIMKILADARAGKAVRAFAESERMRDSLLGGASLIWSAMIFGLQILGLAFFIIALVRPQFGRETLDQQQSGRNIFLAMDCSKSMLAEDVSPNRLTRAKLAAQDLLEKLPEDKVGLIAFAGRAYLQAPLTNDHEALVESIQSLDHTTIPRGGTSIASAIQLAIDNIEKVGGRHHGMILFSDGGETDDATLAAAKDAADHHLLILPVGVGTLEGALIPDPDKSRRGDYIRDENGNVVRAKLESHLLRDVARITGGRYVELASQALTKSLVDDLLAQLDRQTLDSRKDTRPIERYQWPLGAGILFIILSMLLPASSRKVVRMLAPLPVEPQTAVHAKPMASAPGAVSAWLIAAILGFGAFQSAAGKSIDDATREYEEGKYEESRDSYALLLGDSKKDPGDGYLSYGLGAATHQLHDYDRSIRSFSEALKSGDVEMQKRALRGLATSLYNAGDEALLKDPEYTVKAWTDAISHFDTDLALQTKGTKEYQEIKENREFVQGRLDELQEKLAQQRGQKQEKRQKKEGEGDSDEEENDDAGGKQDSKKSGDQKPNQKDQKKQHDALQNKPEMVPQGQIQAAENGQQQKEQQMQRQNPGDERNDKTGFTPTEARSQLRSYADDQKSVQYLMRHEEAPNGKDY